MLAYWPVANRHGTHAIGIQAKTMGGFEHIGGHFGHATEFARQGPFCPRTVAQDAAEHFGTGGNAGDFFDLGHAINRKQFDAHFKSTRDIAFFLDGIAVGDAVGSGTGGQHHFHFLNGSRVEARAHPRQQTQDLGSRIRLHRIKHAGIGQSAGKALIVFLDHFQINDNTGAVFTTVAQKFMDTCCHGTNSPNTQDASSVLIQSPG
jgi:hypothetical protein